MQKNTVVFLSLFAIGSLPCHSSASAYRSSQAIDLLEYDLAKLNIEKEQTQRRVDNTFKDFTVGALCLALAEYCRRCSIEEFYRRPSEELKAKLFMTGMMISGLIGAMCLLESLFFSRNRNRIVDDRIAAIKKQIKRLNKQQA